MEEIGDHTKYKRKEGLEFLEFSARKALVLAKRAQSSRRLRQPSYPPQKRDGNASQRRAKVWEQETERWSSLSPVVTILKVEGIQDTVRRMYAPRFLSCHNEDLKWRTKVIAWLQLTVLFVKQRVGNPGGVRAAWPQKRGLSPS